MASKRRFPVAKCPRCHQRRRVEQRRDDLTLYTFAAHKRQIRGGSMPCRGSGMQVKAADVLN